MMEMHSIRSVCALSVSNLNVLMKMVDSGCSERLLRQECEARPLAFSSNSNKFGLTKKASKCLRLFPELLISVYFGVFSSDYEVCIDQQADDGEEEKNKTKFMNILCMALSVVSGLDLEVALCGNEYFPRKIRPIHTLSLRHQNKFCARAKERRIALRSLVKHIEAIEITLNRSTESRH